MYISIEEYLKDRISLSVFRDMVKYQLLRDVDISKYITPCILVEDISLLDRMLNKEEVVKSYDPKEYSPDVISYQIDSIRSMYQEGDELHERDYNYILGLINRDKIIAANLRDSGLDILKVIVKDGIIYLVLSNRYQMELPRRLYDPNY